MATIESYPAHGTRHLARDIMVTKLVTLKPDTDVFDGIDTLVKNKVSGAPVVDEENRLLGIFSEQSCLEVLIDAAYEGLPTNRVSAFMNPNPATVSEDTDLLTLAQMFIHNKTRRLPVVRDGIVVGQISRRDVIGTVSKIRGAAPTRKDTPLLYLSAMKAMKDAPKVK